MNRLRPFACCSCLAAILVACNLPTIHRLPPTDGIGDTPTAAVPSQTSAALSPTEVLIQVSAAAPTQGLPTPVRTQRTITPATTLSVSPTDVIECDHASAGNPIDISVPDDSSFQPGQEFTKTWRLMNTGSCTWTTDYAASWFSGETFRATLTANLLAPVAPGKTVDISIDMVAPDHPGTYQSNWKMKNRADQLFGIGPNGDAPFWVRIVVSKPAGAEQQATAAPSPTPRIYATGFANLTINDGLDLDRDQINMGKSDDLIYQRNNQSHLIGPENGGQIAQFGKGQPSLIDCQSAKLTGDPQLLDGVSPGMYYCYKTNMGLPGWLRLSLLNPNDHVLTVEILTWATP